MRHIKRYSSRSSTSSFSHLALISAAGAFCVALPLVAGCAGGSGDAPPAPGSNADEAPISFGESDNSPILAGAPVQFSVVVNDPSLEKIRFALDGKELAICDKTNQDDDCRIGNLWRTSTVIDAIGHHILTATSDGAQGPVTATQDLEVVSSLPDEPALTQTDPDEPGDVAPSAINRGFLDPNFSSHNIFGGIHWSVKSQTVIVSHVTPLKTAAKRCMARYGSSIRKWADKYKISRGSVVGIVLAESSCADPHSSSDGLSSGPMQVQGRTCASVYGHGISASECKRRMWENPDFSFEMGIRYMASEVHVTHHDLPKVAGAYNAGGLYFSRHNRWHMRSSGDYIDRVVDGYNGYRAWEKSVGAAVVEQEVQSSSEPDATFEGEHVDRWADLPKSAAEGQVYFVGNWDMRDGAFAEFRDGKWTTGE